MTFKELQPTTKRLIIGSCAGIVVLLILAAAVTGNMEILLGIVEGIVK